MFLCTVSVTTAEPLPVAGDAEIHDGVVTLHAQPVVVDMDAVTTPPSELALYKPGSIRYVQGTGSGGTGSDGGGDGGGGAGGRGPVGGGGGGGTGDGSTSSRWLTTRTPPGNCTVPFRSPP